MKTALIFGITGQDGSYLAELLLDKGYIVHGVIRRSSSYNTARIDHIFDRLNLKYGDIQDSVNTSRVVSELFAECTDTLEIYNLAALSHVKVSFEVETSTFEINTLGVLNILSAIRNLGKDQFHRVKMYQASTSEMFGNANNECRLNENSPMVPVSPYAISKLAAHNLCNLYRDAYGLYIVSSILMNHESPRRNGTFVTKKITDHVKALRAGSNQPVLQLGNVESFRDWGHAKDYVRAIWMMLQQDVADTYVIGTGVSISVKQCVETAFRYIDMPLTWVTVAGYLSAVDSSGKVMVRANVPKYMRPMDVNFLWADTEKAKDKLGWNPEISFETMIHEMIDA